MTLSEVVKKQHRLVAELQRRLDVEHILLLAAEQLAIREESGRSKPSRKAPDQ